MKNIKIYILIDPRNNKIKYVGQTSLSLMERLRIHKERSVNAKNRKVCCWIKSLMNKKLEPIIKLIEDNVIWNESEIKWITHFKSIGIDLLNHTDGGEGTLGYKWSEEALKNISKIRKGRKLSNEHKNKIKIKMENRKVTWGNKISESLKGKNWSKETLKKRSKPVRCIETQKEYSSIHEASRETGLHLGGISRSCKTGYKTKKFTWEFV